MTKARSAFEFSVNDPFPLLDLGGLSYAESLRHSQAVDEWLGFDLESIERTLVEQGCRVKPSGASPSHQQLWFGLAVQSLLTPYVELRAVLAKLRPRPGQTIVDLGAAYARMAFVIDRHWPDVQFVGYEYVGERVREAQRVLRRRGKFHLAEAIVHADLSANDFLPRAADFYFIYDYGTPKAIEKTLYDLRRMSEVRLGIDAGSGGRLGSDSEVNSGPKPSSKTSQEFTLVARGRHCRALIEARHPWLASAYPGEPESRVTIYRLRQSKNSCLTESHLLAES